MYWVSPGFHTAWQVLFASLEVMWVVFWCKLLQGTKKFALTVPTSCLSEGCCLGMAEVDTLESCIWCLRLLLWQDQECMCVQRETLRHLASQELVVIAQSISCSKNRPTHYSVSKRYLSSFAFNVFLPYFFWVMNVCLFCCPLMMERWYN